MYLASGTSDTLIYAAHATKNAEISTWRVEDDELIEV